MKNDEKIVVGAGCLIMAYLLGYAALVVGVIYVVWHFVAKYW